MTLRVLALALLTGCATLHSGLTVEAGSAFQLGANPHGPYTATVENVGPVSITLRTEGAKEGSEELAPGSTTRLRVPANTVVYVDNGSERSARLDVRARGDVGLSMGYVASELP